MWSEEKIWDWYGKNPWIVGFNYLPSNAVNSTEMWQKESYDITLIEKELCAHQGSGIMHAGYLFNIYYGKKRKKNFIPILRCFLILPADMALK